MGIGAINSSPQLPAGFQRVQSVAQRRRHRRRKPGRCREPYSAVCAECRTARSRRRTSATSSKARPGIDLGRVEVLPLYQPDTGVSAPGVVTVMVIPNDPTTPQGPVPDGHFLQAVCNYLEPRRLLTTEVHVVGPDYQDLSVSVGFDIVPGKDVATVAQGHQGRDCELPFANYGRPGGTGWPLGKPVMDGELLAQAARVDGVCDIQTFCMWDGTGTAIHDSPYREHAIAAAGPGGRPMRATAEDIDPGSRYRVAAHDAGARSGDPGRLLGDMDGRESNSIPTGVRRGRLVRP